MSARAVVIALDGDRLGLQVEPLDILQPQPEIDHLDRVLVDVAAAVGGQRAQDREAGDIEIMKHEHPLDAALGQPIEQLAQGGDHMPLVLVIAMSYLSAIRAASSSESKPSFSINRMLRKRFSGPLVGNITSMSNSTAGPISGRSPRYCRTASVPRSTRRPVWGSIKWPRASNTTSQSAHSSGCSLT